MKSVKLSNNDLYIGLDIGTNSVGFCATNSEYDILTKGNHLQCGARLFEGASDASERREKRSVRRRLARKKVRLQILQNIFSGVIDDSFFLSLEESRYLLEDKNSKNKFKYTLFNDKSFTDVDYYNKFPTIYHLRKYLLENETTDIRLLYLACHHMMKYRGHFLFNEFNAESADSSYFSIVNDINQALKDTSINEDCDYTLDEQHIESVITEAKKCSRKTDFWDKVAIGLNPAGIKILKTVTDVLRGKQIKIKDFWPESFEMMSSLDLSDDIIKNFCFKSDKFDESFQELISNKILNDNQITFIILCKKFYDTINLDLILNGAGTISEAQVIRYDNHARDLTVLKRFIRNHLPNEYSKMFRYNSGNKNSTDATYAHYISSSIVSNKKFVSHSRICVSGAKDCNSAQSATYEDFLKYIKTNVLQSEKLTEEAKNSEDWKYIFSRVEDESFCKKLRTIDNAYFPNQLVAYEMEKILKRQKRNFSDFLTDKIISDILKLLTFRIPYFVGPLSDLHSDFAWVERINHNSNVPITPLNFNEEVDLFKSGEKFIERMISKCTYLKDKFVIPAQSLLYQDFMLFNDLNNLKLNGNRINQDLKLHIYNTICQTEMSLTKCKIYKYLYNDGTIKKEDRLSKDDDLDNKFNSSLSSLIKCKKALGIPNQQNLTHSQIDMCEKIIKWHTVFQTEKQPVRLRIEKEYGSVLNEQQIKNFTNLSFSGWGRLSSEFLTEITINYGSRTLSIIDVLREQTKNLMEILNSCEYSSDGHPLFLDLVKKHNDELWKSKSVTYDDVKELYCSPTVKRSIWQSILVVKDLVKANKGVVPKKIFVEVTRYEDLSKKKKLTSSRKEQIRQLFKSAKITDKSLYEQLDSTDNDQLRSDRIFLYFIQLGKCMYTGQPLDFDKVLQKDGMYDIDHIYPQSLVIDDSLSNRVLVLKKTNAQKSDKYPLPVEIRNQSKGFWEDLHNKGLMDSKKLERLISSKPLSYEMIAGFNNRQLVSTNQAVKSVCSLLDKMFNSEKKQTEIIYSKAEHISRFRQLYDIFKCRDVNDLHHGHDAYLNIVVGNVWSVMFKELKGSNENRKFDNLWIRELKRNEEDKRIAEKRNNIDVTGTITRVLFGKDSLYGVTKNCIWKNSYLGKVKSYTINCNEKYLNKFLVTRLPYEKSGAFYDETIHIKGKGLKSAGGLIPLKSNLSTENYGGYRNDSTAYLCLIQYELEKKSVVQTIKSFCKVPVRLAVSKCSYSEFLKQVCEINGIPKNVESSKIKIVYPKILIDQVLEIDGSRYFIRSGNLDCITSCQWYPCKETVQLVKVLIKNIARLNSCKDEEEKSRISIEGITIEDTEYLFNELIIQLLKPYYKQYTFAKKLKDGSVTMDKFKQLPLYARVLILGQMMNNLNHASSKCKAAVVGGANTDNCRWNQANISNNMKISVVTQSATGLFERVIPLID